MKTTIRYAVAALFTISAMTLTACNTVQGVGEDLESAGEATQDAAK